MFYRSQLSMDITEADKKQLEKDLVERLIAALKEDKLSAEELPLAAEFILDRVDKLKTQEELIEFLKELNSRWSIFANLLTLEKGEFQEKQEKEVVGKASALAKAGRLEEAVRLAEEATSHKTEE